MARSVADVLSAQGLREQVPHIPAQCDGFLLNETPYLVTTGFHKWHRHPGESRDPFALVFVVRRKSGSRVKPGMTVPMGPGFSSEEMQVPHVAADQFAPILKESKSK
jgi:hypothetical protein